MTWKNKALPCVPALCSSALRLLSSQKLRPLGEPPHLLPPPVESSPFSKAVSCPCPKAIRVTGTIRNMVSSLVKWGQWGGSVCGTPFSAGLTTTVEGEN